MVSDEMRVARLHGVEDLRIEQVPVPKPDSGELLVEVEANGVCSTDARKYRVGVNDGDYPFNPGHEWVGRVAATGAATNGWRPGDRIYGDTYGGYADYVVIPVAPAGWSCGPFRLGDHVPLERAIFLEPIADCYHALVDQAGVGPGKRVVVVAAGSMGLLMVGLAAELGAEVIAVEPQEDRRLRARRFGATATFEPTGWPEAVWEGGGGADAVILCTGAPEMVSSCIDGCADGGVVVLFAGFGDRSRTSVDLNALHYREVTLVGSEWVGTPARKHCGWYDRAAALVSGETLALESLVTHRCSYDELEETLLQRSSYEVLKTMFTPRQPA